MHMAVNIFYDDDGVIDKNTDGENKGEQGDSVEGEAPDPARK